MQTKTTRQAKTTRFLTVLFVLGNLAFLSWFVGRYAHHYFVQVTALNAACILGQKVGAALAFGNLGWLARGRTDALSQLSSFKAKKHPAYLIGFAINRICSLAPPLYTLGVTWGKLPALLMFYLAADAAIAVWTALHFEKWVRETARALSEHQQHKHEERTDMGASADDVKGG